MKTRRYVSLILVALACLVAQGAVVVGLAYGVGTWLHHEFYQPPAIPPCLPSIDHGC